MSATVGAALKKILVALLSDPKVIKTIFGIIIGIIIIVVMPIIAVVSVFNGSMDIDTDKLNQSIQENISAEQMENLQLINDTMTEVENQLKNKKLSDYNTQAEVIYLFSLSDKSDHLRQLYSQFLHIQKTRISYLHHWSYNQSTQRSSLDFYSLLI